MISIKVEVWRDGKLMSVCQFNPARGRQGQTYDAILVDGMNGMWGYSIEPVYGLLPEWARDEPKPDVEVVG